FLVVVSNDSARIVWVHVLVTGAGGVTLQGAQVSLVAKQSTVDLQTTDEKGQGTLNVPPGSYELVVAMDGFETLHRPAIAVKGNMNLECKLMPKISVKESVNVSAQSAPGVEKGASSSTEHQKT